LAVTSYVATSLAGVELSLDNSSAVIHRAILPEIFRDKLPRDFPLSARCGNGPCHLLTKINDFVGFVAEGLRLIKEVMGLQIARVPDSALRARALEGV
jgi:hypothetical protein